jgi:hypothetical protein
MFKSITINLAGPICKCQESKLGWTVFLNKEGRPGLTVHCLACKVSLSIPNKEFKGSFKLDIPYPGKQPEVLTEDTLKLEVLPGGKLIEMFEKDK